MIPARIAGLLTGVVSEAAIRLAVALNQLLNAESYAARRLAPHAGRRIELRFDVVGVIGVDDALRFAITPAGLLEPATAAESLHCASDVLMTLRLEPLTAASALLSGRLPPIVVDGEPQLVAEVEWLLDNLRWDFEGDIERLVGPTAAHAGARLGAGLAAVARGALDAVTSMRAPSPGR